MDRLVVIYQFHMPLFFFVSGMLYKSENNSNKEYILRKVKSLLLPFWIWNLILYPIYFGLYYWKEWSISLGAKEIIEIICTLWKVPFLGATWFLPALFWVSILVHFVVKIIDKFKYTDVYLLLIGIGICCIGFSITFPYRISRTIILVLFYICGYLFNKYLRDKINEKLGYFLMLVCGVFFVIIADKNIVDMGNNIYKYKIAFIVGAFLATYFVLMLSKFISEKSCTLRVSNYFSYLGKKSMDILIWHFLAFRLAIILQIIVLDVGLEAIISFPIFDGTGIWWMIYLVSGIYGSLLWKKILIMLFDIIN